MQHKKMLETWIILAVLAAISQSVRTCLQKDLAKKYSPIFITWGRFLFGVPIAFIYLIFLTISHFNLPSISFEFLFYCSLAGLSQIVGSIMQTSLLRDRNFAVGIAYSKTEAILAAIFAYILFAEKISLFEFFAIIIGSSGVIILSLLGNSGGLSFENLKTKTSLIGLTLGIFHAFTAIFIREASLSLESKFTISAGLTLFSVMLIQATFLTIYLKIKNLIIIEDFKNYSSLKELILLGVIGVVTSIFWYSAYSIQTASLVNAVGQVELIFSLLATRIIFKEKIKNLEKLGISLIIISVLALVL
ncbi:MAG: EamA family transporter [Rickettsiales bacterium]|nr:EamA family transporter [Rickettsiales bacterium]